MFLVISSSYYSSRSYPITFPFSLGALLPIIIAESYSFLKSEAFFV
jgi:hypothetical protein